MFLKDPGHPRAESNLDFYQNALKNELNKLHGDTGELYALDNDPLVFKNKRPKPHYPERDLYEALCRGEVPIVSVLLLVC